MLRLLDCLEAAGRNVHLIVSPLAAIACGECGVTRLDSESLIGRASLIRLYSYQDVGCTGQRFVSDRGDGHLPVHEQHAGAIASGLGDNSSPGRPTTLRNRAGWCWCIAKCRWGDRPENMLRLQRAGRSSARRRVFPCGRNRLAPGGFCGRKGAGSAGRRALAQDAGRAQGADRRPFGRRPIKKDSEYRTALNGGWDAYLSLRRDDQVLALGVRPAVRLDGHFWPPRRGGCITPVAELGPTAHPRVHGDGPVGSHDLQPRRERRHRRATRAASRALPAPSRGGRHTRSCLPLGLFVICCGGFHLLYDNSIPTNCPSPYCCACFTVPSGSRAGRFCAGCAIAFCRWRPGWQSIRNRSAGRRWC